MNRVLIIEPESARLASLKERLEKEKLWILTAVDKAEAEPLLKKYSFHVCLVPVEQPNQINMIHWVKNLRPHCSVVVMSSNTECEMIVSSIRAGASHFWHRPTGQEALMERIHETLQRNFDDYDFNELEEFPMPTFIGKHPRMREIFQVILNIRNSDSTVLITGESGTGKELVAQAIHRLSPRKKQAWVAINCSAIPGPLLESELFGHMKGSFTGAVNNRMGRFQLAGQGTLFLDEIGDLPLELQAKLLRAIQTRSFEPVGSAQSLQLDARLIAATNQDLENAVAEKRFREDLYYRLNVIPIYLPPLRTRKSDIPFLVRNFLQRFCEQNQKEFLGISEEAMSCLMQYHWPGNVRELENLMERVVVLKRESGIVELKDLPVQYFKNVRLERFVANVALPEEGIDFNEAVNDFENELILQALQKTDGNKNRAAALLNLNRTTLVEKLKRKGLRVEN